MTDVDDMGGKPPLGALFSTAASDNAEVVPPTVPRGPESMWSTEASANDADDGAAAGRDGARSTSWVWEAGGRSDDPDEASDESAGPTRSLWDPVDVVEEGPFTAEPILHDDDVIDAGDLFDPALHEPAEWPSAGTGSVFSNGASMRATATPDDSPWTVLDDEWDDDARSTGRRPASQASGPHRDDRAWGAEQGSSRWADHTPGSGFVPPGAPVADPHGLEAAVARIHPVDQERSAVAIAVCGALLEEDEQVVGVVTGQMLGRPAAVAVTDRRVIIANDRRWQPLVDIYKIDSKLIVRGRHDRQVAALSFADVARLSMIDGITDVELAIELADRIRDTDTGE